MQATHELRTAVRNASSAAAERPCGKHVLPVGRGFAESIGYPPDLLGRAAERRLRRVCRCLMTHDGSICSEDRLLLCEAQTSGGLLFAVPAEKSQQLASALTAAGTLAGTEIGEVLEGRPGRIDVVL